MLQEIFAGGLPWSMVANYMLFLAFLGTISGMVLMSLNLPFIMHTCSYTIGLVFTIIFACRNYGYVRKINAWNPKSNVSMMPVAAHQKQNHISAYELK